MEMQAVRGRLLSSEKKSRGLLLTSRAESSIMAYKRRRIESRNSRKSCDEIQVRPQLSIKPSEFANLLEANEYIFRKSLAFTHAQQLTVRPHRGYVNSLLRSHLKQKDYERVKRERQEVKEKRYISSYHIPRLVESCRLEF